MLFRPWAADYAIANPPPLAAYWQECVWPS